MGLLYFLFSVLSFLEATPLYESCLLESQALETAIHKCSLELQERWGVEAPLELEMAQLEGLLLSYEYEQKGLRLTFSTYDFFQLLWSHQQRFLGDYKPEILVIGVDQGLNPLNRQILLNQTLTAEPLGTHFKMNFPSWELEKHKAINQKGLRLELTDIDKKILAGYQSQLAIFLVLDSSQNKVHASLWNQDGFHKMMQSSTLEALRLELQEYLLQEYALSPELKKVQIIAPRSVWTYKNIKEILLNKTEINRVTPQQLTQEAITLTIASVWKPQQYPELLREFPELKVSCDDRH